MRIIIAFQLALRALRLNLVRTSLTVLGVVIGVASIIIVFSAGDGISRLVSGEIESYGTNVVQTELKTPGKNSASSAEVTTLKLADMEAINKLDNVISSYAASLGQQKMSYGSESKKGFVFGVSAPYAQIDTKTKLAAGSFFTEEDDRDQDRGQTERRESSQPQEDFVRIHRRPGRRRREAQARSMLES